MSYLQLLLAHEAEALEAVQGHQCSVLMLLSHRHRLVWQLQLAFFQIQLLSASAGSSVSATGVYGPPCLDLGGGVFGGYRWLRKRLVLIIQGQSLNGEGYPRDSRQAITLGQSALHEASVSADEVTE